MAVIVVVPSPDTGTGLSRIAASLVSSLRAVRGQVPSVDRIKVVEFADLGAMLEPAPVPAATVAGVPEPASAAAPDPALASAQTPEPATGSAATPESGSVPVETMPAGAAAIERQVLEGWWGAAVRIGQGRGLPQDLPKALAETAHFAHQQHSPVHAARELRRYLTDRKFRHELRERTQACIGPETKVVVGHGLGGLIAYEALCAVNDAIAVSLVTLGPALCGPRVVFELLEPAPRSNQGEWPGAVRHWSNIVSHTDLTAQCEARLTARFGPGIEDLVIEPRTMAESLTGYLLDRSTGLAVATGLAAEFR